MPYFFVLILGIFFAASTIIGGEVVVRLIKMSTIDKNT